MCASRGWLLRRGVLFSCIMICEFTWKSLEVHMSVCLGLKLQASLSQSFFGTMALYDIYLSQFWRDKLWLVEVKIVGTCDLCKSNKQQTTVYHIR